MADEILTACNCNQQNVLRKDCYFYFEVQDMGSRIPTCRARGSCLGDCPCGGCNLFLTEKEAYEIIKDFMEERKGDINDDT